MPGLPFAEPDQIYGEDGTVVIDLEARREVIEVSDSPIEMQPFNSEIIGPTLHVEPGDTIEMELGNATDEPTNIHFHGMHVSPEGISDNVFRRMAPKSENEVLVEVPPDHAPGSYWYHVHLHGSTQEQVMGGLTGLIIVEGLKERLGPAYADVPERQMILRDLQVDPKRKDVVAGAETINSAKPTTRLLNGMLRPKLELTAGQTELWHIGNFSADLYFPIDMPGVTFTVVAEDGNPLWDVVERKALVLPPGKRYDVLVSPEQGTYELETIPYDEGFQLLTRETLADVSVSGDAGEPLPVPESLVDEGEVSLAGDPIAKRRRFEFAFDFRGGGFKAEINGETFDAKKINVAPVLGTTEEWTLVNRSSEDHPFHIHVNDFEVMSIDGRPYEANGLQDIVTIPKGGGEVVIRNHFADFTGEYVFHCHILDHEDAGMMQTVDVVEPGEKPGFQGTVAAMEHMGKGHEG